MARTEMPKFHETFLPILDVLSDGKILHYNDLKIKVRDKHFTDLTEDLLAKKTKNGDQLILNRIGWGKTYLKFGKFVSQPERAMVQITDKGLKQLKSGSLTLRELKNDPDYIAYEAARSQKDKIQRAEGDLENASPQDLIDSGVQEIEESVKIELLEKLKELDPYYFEKVILILLKKMGYGDFQETQKSGDGGIDGIINQDQLGLEKIYIQAKRYNSNEVREKDIRNFIGAMSGDTNKGVFVTTSTFHSGARKKARDAHHTIILIDGSALVDLMYTFSVGVQISTTYELKEIDGDFFLEV